MKLRFVAPFAVALALVSARTDAAITTTFSFVTDVWTNGANTQTGYQTEATSGSVSKDGITMTFQSSLSGTAVAGSRNLTLVTSGNPTGFNIATEDDANDLEGTLLHYQRWDFSFSQAVILRNLGMDDIDSDKTDLSVGDGFRDAIAAEAFQGQSFGPIGSGTDADFSEDLGSSLSLGIISAGSGQTLNYVLSGPAGNPNNAPAYRAYINFGNTPIQSFSIYSFSDRDNVHRVSLFQSLLQVEAAEVIPEPSSSLLALVALPLLARRKRK
ncbi:hypothetical protein OKA05_05160 [Luteolibacter arcticus]|uniref:PEP-CTERM protein-sorting domain-containing protein n=1 Tax=Luteolibacter arcticus TaxID=1581411 RepID=A0ABT3GE76_9BACT|nr:hypothetical protein [Luteolibacter arcticus]MCW1921930.1 hypothetical protein [Luteolibacter arcticus]